MEGVTKAIVGLSIGLILIAYIGSIAIGVIVNASTAGWTTSNKNLWLIIPAIAIIAFLLLILKYADVV